MNKRQKAILRDLTTVLLATVIMVVGMINFKDWVNRSEAMRAMNQLGQVILQYRKERGAVPSQSYVYSIIEELQGSVRLGKPKYRALWIDFESTPDEILAYAEKNYASLLGNGFVVLRLDGRVEWMKKQEFERLLAQQQSPDEIEITDN
ncbi:MAG: hypothetical protein ACYS18_11010 [Planctomycetota bacterium]|jgi:hypothetical protein